jgi:bifunctional non-homologous end joining protein LigD
MMARIPFTPPEPMLADEVPAGPEWLHQIKWDGIRLLTYYHARQTQLFNRRGSERTAFYPELCEAGAYLSAESAVLDGEVIALDAAGKPSFHEVMKREGIHTVAHVDRAVSAVPVTYMVFDIALYNGRWLANIRLDQRLALLADVVTHRERVRTAETFADGTALLHAVRKQQMEGIVSKRRDSGYLIGRTMSSWKKIKNDRDLIAVVGGVTFRGDAVNALLLGLYDEAGRLLYIGHAGSGLSEDDRILLTRAAAVLRRRTMPFARPPGRLTGACWLRPLLTVKVRFREWTPVGSLRQPVIAALVRREPQSCVFSQ